MERQLDGVNRTSELADYPKQFGLQNGLVAAKKVEMLSDDINKHPKMILKTEYKKLLMNPK